MNTLPADVYPIGKNKIEIPINFVPERRKEIQELELWVSTNQGKDWGSGPVARAQPSDSIFPFTAPTDGIYWFSVVVIYQGGVREPADITKVPPALKVLVDTKPPEVRLISAQRQGENIIAQWEIREENPDYKSIALEYKNTDAVSDWMTFPVTPALSVQTTMRIPHGALVRMSAKDLMGTERKSEELKVPSVGEPLAMVTPGTGGVGSTPTPVVPSPASVCPTPTPVVPAPTPPGPGPLMSGPTTTVVPAPIGTAAIPPPPPGPKEWSPQPPIQPVSMTHPTTKPLSTEFVPTRPAPTPGNTIIAVSSPDTTPGSPEVTPAAPPMGGTLPPIQVVNLRQVTMEYEVSKFGPSGVGSVDLYVTRDDGKTWQKFDGGAPPTTTTPTPEMKDTVRRTLTVELPGEGVYGFYMVVQSGAGLSKGPPRSGEVPQMRVELDVTQPRITLYQPVPDPSQRNALVIKWDASDKHLAATPISIEWSEQPTGPWTPIGPPQMSNTNSYSWQVPPATPARVYLRLTARDIAGNVAVATSPKPETVDLNMPEVKIIGFAPKPLQ